MHSAAPVHPAAPCLSSDTASHCRHFPGQELPISHSGLQGQGSFQQVPHHFPQGFVKQHLNGMHLRLGSLAVSVLGGDQQCFQPGTGFARAEPKESAAFQLHSSPACEAWQEGPQGMQGMQPTLPKDTTRKIRGPSAALPSPATQPRAEQPVRAGHRQAHTQTTPWVAQGTLFLPSAH